MNKIETEFSAFTNKYHKHGAYHWMWYQSETKSKQTYINYVNYVRDWIKEKNTLDIGAGDGLMVHVLGIRKGIDNEPRAIEIAKEMGVEIDLGDVHELPYKDEEFDSVFLGHTLEHLEFPDRAIQECKRVLKKYLYIVVPEKEEPFRIDSNGLKEMIEHKGFKLEGEIFRMRRVLYAKFLKL
jgi:ubiquinone/menaquinone biosynthesis C-methylase UbiE